MQDDLKFASEAISRIALEAMASIERLYQNRFPSGSDGSEISPTVIPPIPDFTESEPRDAQDAQDARDDLTLLKPTRVPTRPKTSEAPTFGEVDRPPLIDSNLEKMLL